LIDEQGGQRDKNEQAYGDGNHQLDQREAALEWHPSPDCARDMGWLAG